VSLEADTDAAETLSSYARGVAAGAAQTAFARGFAAGAAAASAGAPKQLGSLRENQANSSPCGERISLDDALCPHAEAMGSTQCQMFWCDPRAFKETALKEQLESEMCMPIKCYRTADMCMRLLRKKQNLQGKTFFRVFLVSWSNAPSLVSFLSEDNSFVAKVIILCDTCGSKGCSRATTWAQQHPGVEVALSWPQAVNALRQCLSDCQKL